jgi:CRP-like cAMP-binding protein
MVIASYLETMNIVQKVKEETSQLTVLDLSKCVKLESFKEGQVSSRQFVINEGERGTKFFIILEGRVAYYINSKQIGVDDLEEVVQLKVGTAESGGSFGELALLKETPRAASVLCETDCSFGVINKVDYVRIIGRHQHRVLEAKISFLASLTIFSEWTRHSLAKLTYWMIEQDVIRHKTIFKENDPNDAVYIIKDGEFKLFQTFKSATRSPFHRKRHKVHLATLGKGELLGVTELLEKSNWKTTCECSSSQGQLLKFKVKVNSTQDFIFRVMSQSYSLLTEIHQHKTSTYKTRVRQLESLESKPKTFDVPHTEEESFMSRMPSIRLHKPKLIGFERRKSQGKPKVMNATFNSGSSHRRSQERTMTNLSQRPDAFDSLRAKLIKPHASRRGLSSSHKVSSRIHTQAVSTVEDYFCSNAKATQVTSPRYQGTHSYMNPFDSPTAVRSLVSKSRGVEMSLRRNMTQ